MYLLEEYVNCNTATRLETPPVGAITIKYVYLSSKTMTDEQLQEIVVKAFGVPLPESAFWSRPKISDWDISEMSPYPVFPENLDNVYV